MSLFTALLGTTDWDGTETVAMDNTDQVAVGDSIRMGAVDYSFEILSKVAGVSVAIDNPFNADIPSGSGGERDDTEYMSDIMNAGDVVRTVLTEETITEPSAPPGTKRPLTVEYKSATVHSTKKVIETLPYESLVSDPDWCRESGRSYEVQAV